MNRILMTLILLAVPVRGWGQVAEKPFRYDGNWYGFTNLGACMHGYGLFGGGLGAEGLLWKGITAGVDTSYQSFTDGWHFGMASVQLGYHFVNRNKRAKWDPFATYGVGIGFTEGGYGGSGNLGGGFNYWFKDRIALRVEARIHGVAGEVIVTGRIGVSFR